MNLDQFERVAKTARNESPPSIDVTEAVTQRLANATVAKSAAPRSGRRRMGWAAIAAVAGIVIWLGLFIGDDTNQALAAIQQVRRVMAEDVDRTYSIHIEGRAFGAPLERHAKMYVRGDSKFVLKFEAGPGGSISAGSDGLENWFVPPMGPVLVSKDASLLDRLRSNSRMRLPFLSIDELLDQLEMNYDLRFLATDGTDIPIRGEIDSNWRPVVADKREASAFGPESIKLWVDESMTQVQRMELSWSEDTLRPGPRRITVVLTSESSLGANFFNSEAHHSPDRAVQVSSSVD